LLTDFHIPPNPIKVAVESQDALTKRPMHNPPSYTSLVQKLILIVFLLIPWQSLIADEFRVAVASNFTGTMKLLVAQFEQQSGHKVILASGSTGKHFAQISNGAPFDAFFAADVHRLALLEKNGLTKPGTRFTYAIGRLALWSPENNVVDQAGKILHSANFKRLAIANPKLAPYGKAAQQVLQAKGLWAQLNGRIVRGENIAQTFQFVMSGNTQLGFVALSQIQQMNSDTMGSYWIVEPSLYEPIEQQAVLLKDKPAARLFMEFVKSDDGRAIIKHSGYDVP